jgi:transcriptional regulator with XRE-family HTH domain
MELQIKQLRENAQYSQEEMAQKMGISQSAYARFELSKTKIDLDRLESFAKQIGKPFIDVITYPERYINVRDIGKELNNSEPEVVVQIKIKGSERENLLKTIFKDNNLEILNK